MSTVSERDRLISAFLTSEPGSTAYFELIDHLSFSDAYTTLCAVCSRLKGLSELVVADPGLVSAGAGEAIDAQISACVTQITWLFDYDDILEVAKHTPETLTSAVLGEAVIAEYGGHNESSDAIWQRTVAALSDLGMDTTSIYQLRSMARVAARCPGNSDGANRIVAHITDLIRRTDQA